MPTISIPREKLQVGSKGKLSELAAPPVKVPSNSAPDAFAALEQGRPINVDDVDPNDASCVQPSVLAFLDYTDARFERLVQLSVTQFLQQSYPYARLLIGNTSGKPLKLPGSASNVSQSPLPVAQVAEEYAKSNASTTPWYMLWNPMTCSHPHRLMMQVAMAKPGYCNVLAQRLHIDLSADVRAHKRPMWVGVILGGNSAYTALAPSYSAAAGLELKKQHTIDNSRMCYPGVLANVAFNISNDVAVRQAFFHGALTHAQLGEKFPGITQAELNQLPQMLAAYGLQGEFEIAAAVTS